LPSYNCLFLRGSFRPLNRESIIFSNHAPVGSFLSRVGRFVCSVFKIIIIKKKKKASSSRFFFLTVSVFILWTRDLTRPTGHLRSSDRCHSIDICSQGCGKIRIFSLKPPLFFKPPPKSRFFGRMATSRFFVKKITKMEKKMRIGRFSAPYFACQH
jgi:hypothetical protein